MASLDEKLVTNGRGQAVERSSLSHLAIGTMATTDLPAARKVYEDFFGFECVRHAPGKLMLRDRRAKYLMESGDRDFFVIEVTEVPEIRNPQANLNHWGLSVDSKAEVERIREIAIANVERYRFKAVKPITGIHGSYGFYFYDLDSNWWEVEYRRGNTNDTYFSAGDWDAETAGDQPVIVPVPQLAPTHASVLGPEAFLTHGTTDVLDTDSARSFYEEVLKLRSVKHGRPAHLVAGGGEFSVVGVHAAARNAAQTTENRWVLLQDSADAVCEIYQRASDSRLEYGLVELTEPRRNSEGHLSFLVETADRNWFEISDRPRSGLIEMFERGDRA